MGLVKGIPLPFDEPLHYLLSHPAYASPGVHYYIKIEVPITRGRVISKLPHNDIAKIYIFKT